MPLSERDNEQIQMAVAVLTEWIDHPNAGAGAAADEVLRRHTQDEADARLQVLRGLVPLAGSMVLALAALRGVSPQQVLQEAGLWLGTQEDKKMSKRHEVLGELRTASRPVRPRRTDH